MAAPVDRGDHRIAGAGASADDLRAALAETYRVVLTAAYEFTRGDLGLKTGLHGREIGGVFQHAAKSLAPFFDHVLPQTTHQGATRVIERQAKVREGRRRRRWRCWIGG